MKTCLSCQADNTDDAIYCKKCGKTLAGAQVDLNEKEILLQIRDLLNKEVKQSEDIQKESREYLNRAEKRARRNSQINVAAICFFVLFIIVILILTMFQLP